jgi:hypothetical protein
VGLLYAVMGWNRTGLLSELDGGDRTSVWGRAGYRTR